MDYEKKYKELVAKIKNAHLYAQTDSTKNVLEGILPELAESEDERIRKVLIELSKEVAQEQFFTNRGTNLQNVIAWLEKQGEPTDNDMVEALRMEYEKGRADVLRCIDPDEMVADFCSQPFSKTRSLASIYRQGITDIIKRINNNEETSTTGTHSIDGGRV